ncbi:MAG: GntR family transcriptional regulator [Pseudonocardiaceae bacterium]
MEPQPTAVVGPLKLRIADDIRMRIERGELAAGDSLPTLDELCEQWRCSANPAREAIALLKQQGLITTGQGKPPVVRAPVQRVVRSSERHQAGKDLVRASDAERRNVGVAAMGVTPGQLVFSASYDVIEADGGLAGAFNVSLGTSLLRRVYEMSDPRSRRRRAWSVSYLRYALIKTNLDLLDSKNEPWPGGTQHQLSTVGIELASVVDVVTSSMPTTAEAKQWELDAGVPLLRVRCISIDTRDRVVEVSDTDFTADRTELRYTTLLKLW